MPTTDAYGIGSAQLDGTRTACERAAGAVGAVERAVCEGRSCVRAWGCSVLCNMYAFKKSTTTFSHVVKNSRTVYRHLHSPPTADRIGPRLHDITSVL